MPILGSPVSIGSSFLCSEAGSALQSVPCRDFGVRAKLGAANCTMNPAVAAFQVALQYNRQSAEISKKIKRLTQLVGEVKRAKEVENFRSSIDMRKYLDPLKEELSGKIGPTEESQDIFSFVVDTMESAIKVWHVTGKMVPRVYFLLDKQKTRMDKYAPVVNIDKYAEESFSRAACLLAPKSILSYPKVWKGQGSRKWMPGQSDGFFVQFESPVLRKIWFVPGTSLRRDNPSAERMNSLASMNAEIGTIYNVATNESKAIVSEARVYRLIQSVRYAASPFRRIQKRRSKRHSSWQVPMAVVAMHLRSLEIHQAVNYTFIHICT